MNRTLLAVASLSVPLLALSCYKGDEQNPKHFTAGVTVGGTPVSAAVLNHGGDVYTHYCRPCHGVRGDGRGPASAGLRPPPRDFRQGVFKFAAVKSGQLPNDDDLKRIIKGGLHGTPMLKWDVPDAEIGPLIQYIKTFSPRWQEEKPGEPVIASADPWAGKVADGVARGAKVYHGMAQCANCHAAYAPKQEIWNWTQELIHGEANFRDDLYVSVGKESDFPMLDSDGKPIKDKEGKDLKIRLLPPDFAYDRLRSGETLPDIYRTIASGIGGTAMPAWKDVLPESDLWAMVHFVKSLVDTRGTPAAQALRDRLEKQPGFTPPAPPPETPPAEAPPADKPGAGKAKGASDAHPAHPSGKKSA